MTTDLTLGETNLDALLKTMSPTLAEQDYVFCSIPGAQYGDYVELTPIAMMQEVEGLTLVIERSDADAHEIAYQAVFKCITLKVHSSLEAVGLTAAFSSKLAEHGISANVVAGYFHDHIFVQSALVDKAMRALGEFN
ncbi:ACT domain-containing protein [Leucothrix sargassi]|nr:ACT domain-containing protein [Leucothrix sargassi]